jgi:type VI secretion system secreted protein VgrG
MQIKGVSKMKNKRLILSVVVALAGFLPQGKASLSLGSAGSFAVLGGSAVANTGDTVLNGDLGVYPTLGAISGFGPGIVNGTIHNNDAVAANAHSDALAAYNILAGETFNSDLTGQVLGTGTSTLMPGVYHFDAAAQLTGTLTLNAQGDNSAVFVFQIGTTLGTTSSSSILLINGAQAGNVFWQVGSSATLGTGTWFDGSILADQSITFDTGASMFGSALALNGTVTLDDNVITIVPEAVAFWPLVFCASVFGSWQWLAVWRRKAGRS